jgi:uncharacterized protein
VTPDRPLNRLAREKSPYLRQHAGNPVDWHPWSDEAFSQAAAEDKPVFLSIGYSACHWCHVMERESFADKDVAAVLNASFVPVKVDREERPDLDHYYMSVCQSLTGGGGWPLTVVLTPERKPFWAGTYFPKTARFGRPGLLEILPQLAAMWRTRRSEVTSAAADIARSPLGRTSNGPGEDLQTRHLDRAFESLSEEFDAERGGFGSAPKFPSPHHCLFLLRYWRRTKNAAALAIVEKTLTAMRLGGIYDHLGFGFHRYATDERWRVPHFEKMLYDQAMLALAYIEAFQATGRPLYRETAEGIFAYVLRDMTSKEGGFFAAEDADSEGEEGRFYVWTADEVRRTLDPGDADFAARLYGVRLEGNFSGAGETSNGKNVFWLEKPLEDFAADFGLTGESFKKKTEKIRRALFRERAKRPRPLRDDKILADWNGLMIAALAKAAQAFDRPALAAAAGRAADFILTRMRRPDGSLFHRSIENDAAIPGFLDDYAFLTWGLLELYEATFEIRFFAKALDFARIVLDRFWDKTTGGFYFTPDDAAELPVRKKEFYDGAHPSGNAVMMFNLLRLGRMTGNAGLEEKAAGTGRAFSAWLDRAPAAFTFWMAALDFALGPTMEIVVAGRLDQDPTQSLLKVVRSAFLPNKVVLHRPDEDAAARIFELAPYIKDMKAGGAKAKAYVCSNFRCSRPVSGPSVLKKLIAG